VAIERTRDDARSDHRGAAAAVRGGGFYGYRSGYYGRGGFGGILGLLVLLAVLYLVFGGGLGGVRGL
jgi:hypothetical protein